jgi:hypothetical protein
MSSNMSEDNKTRNKRKQQQPQRIQTLSKAESIISSQVFYNRRYEIHEYLKLFGYKADKTILQVHITGFFRKKGQQASQKQKGDQALAIKRYGGTSFVIVGRTHDPSIMESVIKPRKKNPPDTSPGYIGYLWKNKDPEKRAPHEVIPLDFTPINLPYPIEWKNMFATKGFMLALHVPSSFARHKNRLTRALYCVGKSATIDVKGEWTFLNDIKQYGFNNMPQSYTNVSSKANRLEDSSTADYNSSSKATRISDRGRVDDRGGDPISIIKTRLAQGKISKEEYEELRKAIQP